MTYIWRKKDNILTAISLSSLQTCHLLLQSICRVVYKSAYTTNVNQLGKKNSVFVQSVACECTFACLGVQIAISRGCNSWLELVSMICYGYTFENINFIELSGMETHHITALGIMLCSFADYFGYKLVFENDTDTNSCLGPILKGKMVNTHDNTEPENFIQLYICQYKPCRTVRAFEMVLERDMACF